MALGGVELLKTYVHGKALADIDFDDLKAIIRAAEGGEQRRELERVVETIGRLEQVGIADAEKFAREQQAVLDLVSTPDELLAKTHGDLFKALLDAANNLLSRGGWSKDHECPLCSSQLDEPVHNHVSAKLSQFRDVSEAIGQITSALRSASWLTRLFELDRLADLRPPADKERALPAKLAALPVTSHKRNCKRHSPGWPSGKLLLSNRLSEWKESKDRLEKESLLTSLVQLTEQVEYGRQVKENASNYLQDAQ